MKVMNSDVVVTDSNSFLHTSSAISISDNKYSSIVTVGPTGIAVEPSLQDIREPYKNRMELTSISWFCQTYQEKASVPPPKRKTGIPKSFCWMFLCKESSLT